MKRMSAWFAAMFLVLAVLIPLPSSAQARQAVVHEAFHALRPAADGGCDQWLSGNCVGSWNWLYNDYNAYNTVKGWYGCFASDWALSGDGSGCYPYDPYVSFYSNPYGYGYSAIGIPYARFGRGGQCKYFANLVVYRSGVYVSSFPTLASMWSGGNSNMQQVQYGDVIVRYNMGYTNHVAIVVQVYTSGGSVTGVDVIDSNWLSESGAANHEIIGRHYFPISTLQGYFRIWWVPGY